MGMSKPWENHRSRCDVLQPETLSVKDGADGGITFSAVAVDKAKQPNRRGFIFAWGKPGDVDVKALRQNPVLLYRHEDAMLPIGKLTKITVDATQVRCECHIPSYAGVAGMESWEAFLAPVRQLVKDGLLRAVSIGFYIKEAHEAAKPVKGPWGEDFTPLIVTKLEIIELSVCSIGAHPSALIEQAAGDADALAQAVPAEYADTLVRLSGETHSDADDWAPADAAEQASTWKAIPFSRHGGGAVADEDDSYDAGAQAKVADPAALRLMGALEDRDNLNVQAGYKLLHHRADDNATVWAGCASAMARLLGARGGIKNASEAALLGAYGHLTEEYACFGKEPPAFKQDYTTDELLALHREGAIAVPGAHQQVQALPERVDALEARFEAAVAALTEAVAELKTVAAHAPDVPPTPDVQDAEPDQPATDTPSPADAGFAILTEGVEDAVRAVIRAMLQAPDARAGRELQVSLALDGMRSKPQ